MDGERQFELGEIEPNIADFSGDFNDINRFLNQQNDQIQNYILSLNNRITKLENDFLPYQIKDQLDNADACSINELNKAVIKIQDNIETLTLNIKQLKENRDGELQQMKQQLQSNIDDISALKSQFDEVQNYIKIADSLPEKVQQFCEAFISKNEQKIDLQAQIKEFLNKDETMELFNTQITHIVDKQLNGNQIPKSFDEKISVTVKQAFESQNQAFKVAQDELSCEISKTIQNDQCVSELISKLIQEQIEGKTGQIQQNIVQQLQELQPSLLTQPNVGDEEKMNETKENQLQNLKIDIQSLKSQLREEILKEIQEEQFKDLKEQIKKEVIEEVQAAALQQTNITQLDIQQLPQKDELQQVIASSVACVENLKSAVDKQENEGTKEEKENPELESTMLISGITEQVLNQLQKERDQYVQTANVITQLQDKTEQYHQQLEELKQHQSIQASISDEIKQLKDSIAELRQKVEKNVSQNENIDKDVQNNGAPETLETIMDQINMHENMFKELSTQLQNIDIQQKTIAQEGHQLQEASQISEFKQQIEVLEKKVKDAVTNHEKNSEVIQLLQDSFTKYQKQSNAHLQVNQSQYFTKQQKLDIQDLISHQIQPVQTQLKQINNKQVQQWNHFVTISNKVLQEVYLPDDPIFIKYLNCLQDTQYNKRYEAYNNVKEEFLNQMKNILNNSNQQQDFLLRGPERNLFKNLYKTVKDIDPINLGQILNITKTNKVESFVKSIRIYQDFDAVIITKTQLTNTLIVSSLIKNWGIHIMTTQLQLSEIEYNDWKKIFDLMNSGKVACIYIHDIDNFAIVRHRKTGDIYVTSMYSDLWGQNVLAAIAGLPSSVQPIKHDNQDTNKYADNNMQQEFTGILPNNEDNEIDVIVQQLLQQNQNDDFTNIWLLSHAPVVSLWLGGGSDQNCFKQATLAYPETLQYAFLSQSSISNINQCDNLKVVTSRSHPYADRDIFNQINKQNVITYNYLEQLINHQQESLMRQQKAQQKHQR